jgi:hypothetical protein
VVRGGDSVAGFQAERARNCKKVTNEIVCSYNMSPHISESTCSRDGVSTTSGSLANG